MYILGIHMSVHGTSLFVQFDPLKCYYFPCSRQVPLASKFMLAMYSVKQVHACYVQCLVTGISQSVYTLYRRVCSP
jgi:hypothetical protein